MLIAHEAPLRIMETVQSLTDYDYCLVHLLEESKEYLNFFRRAKKRGRKIIMDCSLFELGHAFDPEKYFYWLQQIQPSEYIIPDVWQNTDANMESYELFEKMFDLSKLEGKKIGVLQGLTYEELEKCYKFMDERADKIAISFGYDFYKDYFTDFITEELKSEEPNRNITDEIIKTEITPAAFAAGRINLIKLLSQNEIININKPHHLLGCGIPVEFSHYKQYKELYPFLESLDTSHPVISGMFGESYFSVEAVNKKNPTKMVELFNSKVSKKQYQDILTNIRIFRDNSSF